VKRVYFGLALAVMLLSACAASGRLAVQDAWSRPTAAGNNGAVYLVVSNGGSSDDVLLGASADIARAVEMHETMAVDTSEEESSEHSGMDMGDDAMQMMPLDSLLIPAGEEVTFTPGAYHVMLVEIQEELVEGESFMITLHFEQAGDVEVEVVVERR
jgi:hypothetical protein